MRESESAIREGYTRTEIGGIPENWDDGNLFLKTMLLFLEKERFLLEQDLNERTISHKLAEYFNFAFSGYDVDCEYNRMDGEKADKEYVAKRLDLTLNDIPSDSTVFPDIIVHKRGNNNDNYLVIEIKKKKFANHLKKASDEKYSDFDKRKLLEYTKQLNYQWGIYIEFSGDRISELEFYEANSDN